MRTNSELTIPESSATQLLLDAFVEERHVVLRFPSSSAAKMNFRKPLGQRGVVREIGERDFRLDHPELGEVAAGVRVLGAERRAERVDLGEREAIGLDVELAGHGQERFAAEEVLGEVDLAVAACAAGWRGRASRRGTSARRPRRRRR